MGINIDFHGVIKVESGFFSKQDSMTLKHGGNPRCLDMDPENEEVFVSSCDGRKESQKWKWERADERRLGRWDEDPWP